MRRVFMAVAVMLVLTSGNVRADADLTAIVNAAYGARVQDATLHDLAHQRAGAQIAFSGGVCGEGSLTHVGLTTAEVLACNFDSPARAVEQWIGSPAHAAILGDASLTAIGCASEPGQNGATFYACVLAPIPAPGPAGQPPNVGGSESTPLPAAPLLPNTATAP